MRYVHSDLFKEWFLFCSPIETITKATDFLKKITLFFKTENFLRNDLSVCCIDRAPVLINTRSNSQVHVKCRFINIKYSYCMIYRLALALKSLHICFVTF